MVAPCWPGRPWFQTWFDWYRAAHGSCQFERIFCHRQTDRLGIQTRLLCTCGYGLCGVCLSTVRWHTETLSNAKVPSIRANYSLSWKMILNWCVNTKMDPVLCHLSFFTVSIGSRKSSQYKQGLCLGYFRISWRASDQLLGLLPLISKFPRELTYVQTVRCGHQVLTCLLYWTLSLSPSMGLLCKQIEIGLSKLIFSWLSALLRRLEGSVFSLLVEIVSGGR